MKMVIIGLSAAGLSALETLLRFAPEAEITAVSEENRQPYCRCLLTQYLGREVHQDFLTIRDTTQYPKNVTWLLGKRALQIDPEKKSIACASGRTLGYDLEVFVGYKKYAQILKWLGLALLAYPITALMVHEPWRQILIATFIPHLEFSFDFLFIVVGVFGTTISPYMFFWEASQEVEEEISLHMIVKEGQKPIEIRRFLRNLRIDNAIGMVYAEVIQWFIIITTATVLFSHGIKNIGTAADAAKALEPFAGSYAKDVFAIGVVGIGLLAL